MQKACVARAMAMRSHSKNFFIRADSGQMGKLKVGLSGSKRDLMPVLASVSRRESGMAFDYAKHNFKPNVLRYYGDAAISVL